MKFSAAQTPKHLIIKIGRKRALLVDMGRTPKTRRRNWLNLKGLANHVLTMEDETA